MSQKKCKICGKEISEKELCSEKCLREYINSDEFNNELNALLDSLDKPKTKNE